MVYEFYQAIDPVLIFAFRLIEPPILGYLLGNLYIALICALLGELTLALLFKVNRKHYQEQNKEMMRNQSISIQALMQKNKEDFKAANRLANDAFGRSFFAGIAFSSSSLWPVPFALGWLGFRFGHLDFELLFPLPLLGESVSYTAVFLLTYILARIMGTKLRKRLFAPAATAAQEDDVHEQYYTWKDLHAPANIDKDPAEKHDGERGLPDSAKA